MFSRDLKLWGLKIDGKKIISNVQLVAEIYTRKNFFLSL
jgi:hypothetical protein